jgi:flagellar biosynthesis/type III secretory pathway protein FliH
MGTEARILKATSPLEARRITSAVYEADLRVRETIAAAEQRARTLVEDAEAARSHVLAEAREMGRREGLAEVAGALARAAAERDRILAQVPREVAGLALAVARRILGREAQGAGTALALAEAAVAAARGRRLAVLRVNPADVDAVRAGEGQLAARLGGAPIEVREDPSVAVGGAVVDTDAGRIDASIEAQLEVFARAFDEALA